MTKKIFFILTAFFLVFLITSCKIEQGTQPGLQNEDYIITFENNGHGTKPNPVTNVTAIPNSLPVLVEEGWDFEGWYKDIALRQEAAPGSSISSDITLYASWTEKQVTPPEPETYTIKFENNGHGSKPESISDVKKIPDTLPVLEAEGYTFEGWYLDNEFKTKTVEGSTITANTTLYAKWKELPVTPPVSTTYSVTYDVLGHGTAPASVVNVLALPSELPIVASINGWRFDGWYLDSKYTTKAEAGKAITKDTKLYAKWTQVFTITYDVLGHGTAPTSVANVSTLPAELPVVSAEGYVFEDWYLDANCTTIAEAGSVITADTKLYAKWVTKEADKFSVTYNVLGHGTAPASVVNVISLPATFPILTEEGWNFDGWYLDSTLKTKAVEGTTISANTTLYAKWEILLPETLEVSVSFSATSTIGELKLSISTNQATASIWYILGSSNQNYTNLEIKSNGALYQSEVVFSNLEEAEYKIFIYAEYEDLSEAVTQVSTPLSSIYEQFMDYFSGDWNMPGLFEKDGTPHAMPQTIEQSGNIINVLNFGAKANDSSKDNFAAFKSAISNAQAGDVVYIPNGIYYFTGYEKASSEYYAHIILKSNVTLRGESKEGVVLVSCFTESMNEKSSTTLIAAVNVKNVAIKNLTVSSNTSDSVYTYDKDNKDLITNIWTGPKYGITAATGGTITSLSEQARNILIDNVIVEKFRRIGIRIAKAQEVVVRNSTFRNATCLGGGGNGYGVCIQGIGHDDDCTDTLYDACFNLVENCEFLGPWLRHGTLIQYYAHNNLVQNNTYDNTLLDAIDMHGEEEYSNELCNNSLKNVRAGAAIGVGNSGSTHDATGRNTFIHNNTIINCTRGIDVLLGTNYTVIYQNEIQGSTDITSHGINCRDADDVKILENTFKNIDQAVYINAYTVWGPSILGVPNNYLIRDNTFISCQRGISIKAKGENFIIEDNTFESIASNRQIVDDSSKYVLPADTLTIEILDNHSNYSLKITTEKPDVITYYYLTDKEEAPSLTQIKKENSSVDSIISLTDIYPNTTNYIYVLCQSGQTESLLLMLSFEPEYENPIESFVSLSLGEVEYAQVNATFDNPNQNEIKYLFTKEKLQNPTLSDLTQITSSSSLLMTGLVEETTYYLYAYLSFYDNSIFCESITTGSWVHFNTATIDKLNVNIYNASDFYHYVEASNNSSITSNSADLRVTLHSDIFLSENQNVDMISADFKGIFDGQGYTIYNLKMVGAAEFFALYKRINNGTFKNTNFSNADVSNTPTTSTSNHGTAIITADLKGCIENVSIFDSKVESKDTDSRVGAIVGRLTTNDNEDSKVMKSAVVNSIIIGQKNVGGAIGFMDYSKDNTSCKQFVLDLYVSGTIYGNENVGGAVGYCRNEIKNVVTDVTLTFQNGVSTTKKNFGQVVGFLQNCNRSGVEGAKASSLLSYQDGVIFGSVSATNGTINLDENSLLLVGQSTNQYQTNLNLGNITKDYLQAHATFDVATNKNGNSIWLLENNQLILRNIASL